MTYIYQRERVLIQTWVKAFIDAHHLGGDVLDVGAGSFLRYRNLFSAETRYDTQDIHPAEGLKHAYVGDARSIPAPDASYDVILSTQVLEHVSDPLAVMHEMGRLLRPNGHVILSCPQTNEIHEAPYDFFRYTRYGVKALAERAGLRVVEIAPIGDFWTMLARDWQRFVLETFHLHDHPWMGRVASRLFRLGYAVCAWADCHLVCASLRGRFTIGWVALLVKSASRI